MDPQVQKLARKLGNETLARILVRAGLDNPRRIREATDKELEAIDGIGKVTRAAIRAWFPKAKP